MLFYKTIKNNIMQSRYEYDKLMLRRCDRLIEFITHDVPKFIILNETKLLSETFIGFIFKKYMRRLYENTRRVI